ESELGHREHGARTQRSQRKGRGRTQRKGLATKGAKGAKVWVFSILRLLCFLWLNPFLGLMVRTLCSLCPSSGLALWLTIRIGFRRGRFRRLFRRTRRTSPSARLRWLRRSRGRVRRRSGGCRR